MMRAKKKLLHAKLRHRNNTIENHKKNNFPHKIIRFPRPNSEARKHVL